MIRMLYLGYGAPQDVAIGVVRLNPSSTPYRYQIIGTPYILESTTHLPNDPAEGFDE